MKRKKRLTMKTIITLIPFPHGRETKSIHMFTIITMTKTKKSRTTPIQSGNGTIPLSGSRRTSNILKAI